MNCLSSANTDIIIDFILHIDIIPFNLFWFNLFELRVLTMLLSLPLVDKPFWLKEFLFFPTQKYNAIKINLKQHLSISTSQWPKQNLFLSLVYQMNNSKKLLLYILDSIVTETWTHYFFSTPSPFSFLGWPVSLVIFFRSQVST